MKIRIGMRTVKTAVCAAIGILIAQQLGLLYPASAGIIALLSVTNTKRSSFETGFYRTCALVLATLIAYLCFTILGYHAVAFGIYLLFFIPLAVSGKMSDGIPVSSVLVTHYLIEQRFDLDLILNSFCLLFIGVGLALLANLYMPNTEERIKKDKSEVDQSIRYLLFGMSHYLDHQRHTDSCDLLLEDVVATLERAEEWAKKHSENQLLSADTYYTQYFDMRRLQVNILSKMNELVKRINVDEKQVARIKNLLTYSAETFSEENDGVKINEMIEESFLHYRFAELPKTREEFENRARLYQLLNEFQRFIEIKVTFSKDQVTTN